MERFNLVYEGHAFDLPIETLELRLRASIGRWKGQRLDDTVAVEMTVTSPSFVFDPTGDPDDAFTLSPAVNTQWLDVPIRRFADRDYRSLETIAVDFEGNGTINALTQEEWREPPGVMTIYRNEFFARATIAFRHVGGGMFEVALAGTTEFGTAFDLAFRAPLTARLVAYRGEGTKEDLLAWFDSFLRRDDFTFDVQESGEDVVLSGRPRS